ncbi:hypothetical protein O6H91_02G113400 [Diphasiastrum complanatum]|uniref:Uncharacterized protein n=1 Tax=Diphasiastrum complanatum TaxID=34168 RepID=A0ACC2EJV7_DIPCM|nr:hypothetical protein O6H91_02G113400 [Diphasiastrum complanatum]
MASSQCEGEAKAHGSVKQHFYSPGLLQSVHLLSAVTVVFGVWILPALFGFHLITHPLQTIRCTVGITLPVVLLAYSPLQLRKRTCSVWWVIGHAFLSVPIGAMAVAFLAIACGAPIAVEYASRTLHWSIFMSILLVLPAAMVLGTSWPDWHRIFALTRPKRDVEFLICIPAHGAAIGAWLGAWVMPLDWDRLWQDWPISCTYGAVGGYLSGLFVSSILTYFQSTFDWLKAE